MNSLQRLYAAAAMLGADLSHDPLRERNRHRCTACGCEIPPGKAGRMCVECRTIGPPQFVTTPTGQRIPVKRGENIRDGDMLGIENGQVVVIRRDAR